MFSKPVSGVIALALLLASPFIQANDRVDYLDSVPYLITTGDPFDPAFANAPGNPEYKSGVGSIFIQFAGIPQGGFICTASAISPTHILTAAHCLRNVNADGSPDTVTNVLFVLPSTGQVIPTTGFKVNELFDFFEPIVGAFAPGDVAVIELAVPLSPAVEIYELYRGSDELGQETQHYGHGRSGVGEEGATGGADFFYARTGKNQYDETFQPFFGPLFQQLIHDFDNGSVINDATAWWYSPQYLCPVSQSLEVGKATRCNSARGVAKEYKDLGFGALEVGIAPGDSGGPGFIDGKIAGVHSFGFTHGCVSTTGNRPDATCPLDSSYGEMAGDARVSTNAAWIDDAVNNGVDTPIPEPLPVPAQSEGAGGAGESMISPVGRYLMGNSVARHLRLKIELPEEK